MILQVISESTIDTIVSILRLNFKYHLSNSMLWISSLLNACSSHYLSFPSSFVSKRISMLVWERQQRRDILFERFEKKINCVIVARIKARRRSIRENDVIWARVLMSLIDWLTRKVEKNVIDCKEIELKTFELCLWSCACDERDLSLIELRARDVEH